MQEALQDCDDPVQILRNARKASRILRTSLVEALDVQMDYYSSLPNYQPAWIIQIIKNTIDSLIALFPLFVSGEEFRMELLGTAANHLKARSAKSSKPPTQAVAQPEIAAQLGPSPNSSVAVKAADSVGARINRLREECHLTVEELAERIDIDVRSVRRHLRGHSVPYDRHLWAYERLFSKLLNRQVVLHKVP